MDPSASGLWSEPDYVLVLDPSLLSSEHLAAGLREGGLLLANGPPGTQLPTEGPFQKVLFNATDVSLRHGLGTPTAPIVNTALLGAFAAPDREHDRVLSFAEPRYYYDVGRPRPSGPG